MPEEYLQAAFEIKASCDEISRRILRWHWENKPGSHSFESLIEHLERRQEESPTYYGHMPDIGRKTSWQQLDTTLCMRVLLDPENDAAKPLDLLGNTPHPGAARRACNAVRMARNEGAHAADRSSGGRAAILFDEAVQCLEEAYAGTAFSEKELSKSKSLLPLPKRPRSSGKASPKYMSIPLAPPARKPQRTGKKRAQAGRAAARARAAALTAGQSPGHPGAPPKSGGVRPRSSGMPAARQP